MGWFQAGVDENINIMGVGNTQGAMYALKKMQISNGGNGGRIITTASIAGLLVWVSDSVKDIVLLHSVIFRALDLETSQKVGTPLPSGETLQWLAVLPPAHPNLRLMGWRAMLWLPTSPRRSWQCILEIPIKVVSSFLQQIEYISGNSWMKTAGQRAMWLSSWNFLENASCSLKKLVRPWWRPCRWTQMEQCMWCMEIRPSYSGRHWRMASYCPFSSSADSWNCEKPFHICFRTS